MGIVLVLIGQAITQDVPDAVESGCEVRGVTNSTSLQCRVYNASSKPWQQEQPLPMDFTYPLILYVVLGVLAWLALVLLFRPKYKRLEMEERAEVLSKLQEGSDTPASSVASSTIRKHNTSAFLLDSNTRPNQQTSTQL